LKPFEKNYKRIVIKIGSSLLYSDKKVFDELILRAIVEQITLLVRDKLEVVLVSSGAIATGMSVLAADTRPHELASLQALAAVGQHFLMSQYSNAFHKENLECGQILLTWEDFDSRQRYLNAKNTIFRLLQLGIVPIINENDTVSTDEIKFGDNDRLSALVSTMIAADVLVILSDVDGLMDRDKKVIPVIDNITPEIKSLACPTQKKTCVGGMITKIEAARIAVDSGIPVVIANGRTKEIILSVIKEPQRNGTMFLPKKNLAAKERWIAFGTKPKGKICVDDGAKNALMHNKSLLAVGVIGIEGNFEAQDVVSLTDKQGTEFARGKGCISSRQLEKVKGSHNHKEIIHCDNIVIL